MAISFNTDDKLTIYRTQGGERGFSGLCSRKVAKHLMKNQKKG